MVCQIDWVTAKVPCHYDGDITGGFKRVVDENGVIELERDRFRMMEGSYSSRLAVIGNTDTSMEFPQALTISGNLVKFLQGHNLFGSDDLVYLVKEVMGILADKLKLPVTESDRAAWEYGLYQVSRVDVTRMHDLGAPARVNDFLTSAAQVSHSRYQSAGTQHGTTLYIGKHSRRASLKLYDKLAELKVRGHELPDNLPRDYYHKLMEFASGKLRAEATVRSMWLKDHNLALAYNWFPEVAENVLDGRMEGLELSDTMRLTDEYVGELPGNLVLVYDAWRAGRDLRSMYSKAHFYRLRAQLLPYGIDIAHVRPREVVAENQYLLGAPLKSFIQGGGVEVPVWARGTPMYAEGSSDAAKEAFLRYMQDMRGRQDIA